MRAFWAALVACLLCGCSTFNSEWKAAAAAGPGPGIEGAWAGDWRSEKNSHHGSLKCVVSKASEGSYRAHFRARYMKVLRYTYVATLQGKETNGIVALAGEADLGWLAGGVYKYKGTASGTEFKTSYEAKYDHGVFEMKRP